MGNILSCQLWRSHRRQRAEIPIHSYNLDSLPAGGHRTDDEPPTKTNLVIGIDFGTTFTGAAFVCTANLGKATSLAEMGKAADKISVIKTWPNHTNNYTEKTPSILAYNRNPPAWGGNVRPTDEPQVAYFKLGLQEDVITLYPHYSPEERGTGSVLGGYLSDSNWRHPKLPEMRPVNYAADYLSRVNKFINDEILSNHFGERFLQNQKMSYIITVPAIWSDKAKELTRTAAITAGIKGENLTLITEPEAAALYCATLCHEVDLQAGDRFMICDAGGGTVDLIVYKVVSMYPFEVEECTVGTGAACGAIYLDQRFETLVLKKFESAGINLLGDKRLAGLVQQFDSSIKRRFNPFDSFMEGDFEIPIGMPDIPSIGLHDGYLTLTKEDIQEVFDPIFDQILELIKSQLDTVIYKYGTGIKTIFLVGGLGSSIYLLKFLQFKLKGLSVKQPEAGYTAIMRGAVLHKLGLDFVKKRMMRVSYGTENFVPFEEGRHPESRRVLGFDGLPRCNGVMHWFAQKGTSIADGTVLNKSFYSDYNLRGRRKSESYISINELWICEENTAPEYMDLKVMKLHVRLTVNLKRLPEDAWERREGRDGAYNRVRYELGLGFGAGGIEWRLLHQGKIIGSINCEYI